MEDILGAEDTTSGAADIAITSGAEDITSGAEEEGTTTIPTTRTVIDPATAATSREVPEETVRSC